MSYKHIDDALQWTGAIAIIAGHVLNAVGPAAYPYNIAVFAVGTVAFLAWASRVIQRIHLTVWAPCAIIHF